MRLHLAILSKARKTENGVRAAAAHETRRTGLEEHEDLTGFPHGTPRRKANNISKDYGSLQKEICQWLGVDSLSHQTIIVVQKRLHLGGLLSLLLENLIANVTGKHGSHGCIGTCHGIQELAGALLDLNVVTKVDEGYQSKDYRQDTRIYFRGTVVVGIAELLSGIEFLEASVSKE